MLALLQRRKYQFITLDQAMADPAYSSRDSFVGDHGPSWLHRWTVARKEPMRMRDEPDMQTFALRQLVAAVGQVWHRDALLAGRSGVARRGPAGAADVALTGSVRWGSGERAVRFLVERTS